MAANWNIQASFSLNNLDAYPIFYHYVWIQCKTLQKRTPITYMFVKHCKQWTVSLLHPFKIGTLIPIIKVFNMWENVVLK